MAMIRMQPSQYAGVLIPSSTSTTDTGVDFEFQATQVQVTNDRTGSVYLNFNSTTGSTGGYRTCSGESLTLTNFGRMSGMGLASTTTSTAATVRVLALG